MSHNRTKFKAARQALILDNLDFSDYDLPETMTDIEKLHSVFMSEYGHNVERYGMQEALKNWLLGLPTCCTIPFYNHDIEQWGIDNGMLPENPSEAKSFSFTCPHHGLYWNGAAMTILSMFNKIK
jgi:hypothetical protein